MDVKIIILGEVSQRKTNIWCHLCMESKTMIQMNLSTNQKQIPRFKEWTYGYQSRSRGGIDWEFGIDMYTLLYLIEITNKELLYSTGISDDLGGRGEGRWERGPEGGDMCIR